MNHHEELKEQKQKNLEFTVKQLKPETKPQFARVRPTLGRVKCLASLEWPMTELEFTQLSSTLGRARSIVATGF